MSGKNQGVKVTIDEDKKGNTIVNIKLTETADKIRLAVAKSTSLEEALLRVDTISPEEVKTMLGEEMYALEVHQPPSNLNPDGVNIPNNFRYVTSRPIRIDGLNLRDDGVLVNSDILVPYENSGTVSKIEDLLIENKADARFLCELLTNIEIESVHAMGKYVEKMKKFLEEQKANNRF